MIVYMFIPSAQQPEMRCATSGSHLETSYHTGPRALTGNASLWKKQKNKHFQ